MSEKRYGLGSLIAASLLGAFTVQVMHSTVIDPWSKEDAARLQAIGLGCHFVFMAFDEEGRWAEGSPSEKKREQLDAVADLRAACDEDFSILARKAGL